MAELTLEYETHRLIVSQEQGDRFTKVTNYVKNAVYNEMLDTIFDNNIGNPNFYFVGEERIMLNNFLQSLVGFHNRDEIMGFVAPNLFYTFKDDQEYAVFCFVNDLKYEEQIWYKTAFIHVDIYTAYTLIKNASVKLLSTLYPQYYKPSRSLLKEWALQVQRERDLYKCDPDAYEEFLLENDISAVYHFTSYKNVESIKKHGICSLSYLKELGVKIDFVSSSTSQSLDKHKGLEDYIHLGFEERHPMLMKALVDGKLAEYKVYCVNPSVLFLKTTKYSDRNAVKNGAKISDKLEFLLNIPFKLFHKKRYRDLPQEGKDLFQSEILVKRHIPNDLILNNNE